MTIVHAYNTASECKAAEAAIEPFVTHFSCRCLKHFLTSLTIARRYDVHMNKYMKALIQLLHNAGKDTRVPHAGGIRALNITAATIVHVSGSHVRKKAEVSTRMVRTPLRRSVVYRTAVGDMSASSRVF